MNKRTANAGQESDESEESISFLASKTLFRYKYYRFRCFSKIFDKKLIKSKSNRFERHYIPLNNR